MGTNSCKAFTLSVILTLRNCKQKYKSKATTNYTTMLSAHISEIAYCEYIFSEKEVIAPFEKAINCTRKSPTLRDYPRNRNQVYPFSNTMRVCGLASSCSHPWADGMLVRCSRHCSWCWLAMKLLPQKKESTFLHAM